MNDMTKLIGELDSMQESDRTLLNHIERDDIRYQYITGRIAALDDAKKAARRLSDDWP